MSEQVAQMYELARERYAELGVDTEAAMQTLANVAISLHCWQGDDVGGFEDPDRGLSGGIMATGNYPGKARTAVELRQDLDKAYSLIPGNHRLNLHAIYLESDKKVPRNEIEPKHFAGWVDWAKANNHGIDFNPTCFSHPLADDGFTLAHQDQGVRDFWIEHCIASREIGAYFGRELGTTAVTNIWIPDGYKDTPVDRTAPRQRLRESLDAILAKPIDPAHNLDLRWNASYLASAQKAMWSAHMNFTWVMRPQSKHYCVLTQGTSTRRKPSLTKYRRCCCTYRNCCCTSVAVCVGTAIMW